MKSFWGLLNFLIFGLLDIDENGKTFPQPHPFSVFASRCHWVSGLAQPCAPHHGVLLHHGPKWHTKQLKVWSKTSGCPAELFMSWMLSQQWKWTNTILIKKLLIELFSDYVYKVIWNINEFHVLTCFLSLKIFHNINTIIPKSEFWRIPVI